MIGLCQTMQDTLLTAIEALKLFFLDASTSGQLTPQGSKKIRKQVHVFQVCQQHQAMS